MDRINRIFQDLQDCFCDGLAGTFRLLHGGVLQYSAAAGTCLKAMDRINRIAQDLQDYFCDGLVLLILKNPVNPVHSDFKFR